MLQIGHVESLVGVLVRQLLFEASTKVTERTTRGHNVNADWINS